MQNLMANKIILQLIQLIRIIAISLLAEFFRNLHHHPKLAAAENGEGRNPKITRLQYNAYSNIFQLEKCSGVYTGYVPSFIFISSASMLRAP